MYETYLIEKHYTEYLPFFTIFFPFKLIHGNAYPVHRSGDKMGKSDADSVRITLTLKEKVYKKVKRVSDRVGLRPSTWMTMVVTSKVNEIEPGVKADDF